jgi:hypothetical protein
MDYTLSKAVRKQLSTEQDVLWLWFGLGLWLWLGLGLWFWLGLGFGLRFGLRLCVGRWVSMQHKSPQHALEHALERNTAQSELLATLVNHFRSR